MKGCQYILALLGGEGEIEGGKRGGNGERGDKVKLGDVLGFLVPLVFILPFYAGFRVELVRVVGDCEGYFGGSVCVSYEAESYVPSVS